ncbi:MAG: enoyl-CoA hydratase-related protein, partial [Gammaproteobacteria bacterium]
MSKDQYAYEIDSNKIAWLGLDKPNSKLNSLGVADLEALDAIFDDLSKLGPDALKGLVIYSKKKTGFLAGADVKSFQKITTADAEKLLLYGQAVFLKLEKLSCKTLALINGVCLGGGMELALACDHRIALDSPKTKLGLPEVRLGIHPGWGGTVRAVHLLGLLTALPMMLSGKLWHARAAQKIGLIDAAVPQRQLFNTARYYILNAVKPRLNLIQTIMKFINQALYSSLGMKLITWYSNKNLQESHVNPNH